MIEKVKNWFKGVIVESKAITWPSKKRVYNDSLVVIASLVLGGAVIALLDYGFLELFKYALSKVG